MATLTVLYPAGGTRFDRAYYKDSHAKVVRDAWGGAGLTGMQVAWGDEALGGGDAPFQVVTILSFGSRAALDAALAGPSAPAVFADVANFTDVAPIAIVGES